MFTLTIDYFKPNTDTLIKDIAFTVSITGVVHVALAVITSTTSVPIHTQNGVYSEPNVSRPLKIHEG